MLTTNCGTPVYMAPQIWKGEAYGNKVDMWSVGVVMYYLLSGSHPFEGEADTIGDLIVNKQVTFDDPVWNIITSGGTIKPIQLSICLKGCSKKIQI